MYLMVVTDSVSARFHVCLESETECFDETTEAGKTIVNAGRVSTVVRHGTCIAHTAFWVATYLCTCGSAVHQSMFGVSCRFTARV